MNRSLVKLIAAIPESSWKYPGRSQFIADLGGVAVTLRQCEMGINGNGVTQWYGSRTVMFPRLPNRYPSRLQQKFLRLLKSQREREDIQLRAFESGIVEDIHKT